MMMTPPVEPPSWLRDLRIVVLDRDGVLNKRRLALVRRPQQLELLPGVPEALATLHRLRLRLYVATNQPHVSWGWIRHLDAIHARLDELAGEHGARFAGIYACTHAATAGCPCRKPRPGLVTRALHDAAVKPGQAVMIGDHPRDIRAGIAAGTHTCFLPSARLYPGERRHAPAADLVVADLAAFATLAERAREEP